MVAYSALTGAAITVLPVQSLFALAVPLVLAVGVILWLLPDGNPQPAPLLSVLLVWFVGVTALWPAYLSVDLPGLPWINPQRIVVFMLLLAGLWGYATSSHIRHEVAAVLRAVPLLRSAFWVFWFATLITLALSKQPGFSLNRWVNNQILWTFVFLLSAWVATKGPVIDRVAKVLVWSALFVSLNTIWEFHLESVPWADHIPSFLRVDETLLGNVLRSQARTGTGLYRARGPFTTSLVCGEFLAMAFPFMIHATLQARTLWRRALLVAAMIAAVAADWFTGSRLAMVGFFLSVMLYGGFAVFRHWRRDKHSLVSASMMAMVPVAGLTFLLLSLTWPRLHHMTFGGAQHEPSNAARSAQWSMGLDKLAANPIGHGAATSGVTLGYTNPAGVITVDTYYVTLLLDYGVIGFVAFMTMFIAQAWPAMRLYLAAQGEEQDYAGPIAISLLNFIVIKSVSSGEVFSPYAFMMLGFLFALVERQQRLAKAPGGVAPPAAWAALPRGVAA